MYVRLEIEAQEQALEQLEKSTQEATRKAHDAEQKSKSALDALKVCHLPLLARVDHRHLFHPDNGNLLDTSTPGACLAANIVCNGCSTLTFPSTEDSLNRAFDQGSGDDAVPQAEAL